MIDPGYPVLTTLIFFPVLAAAVVMCFRNDGLARTLTLWASAFECVLAIPLLRDFNLADVGFQFAEKAEWIP